MKKAWIFQQNPFYNATVTNFAKFKKIAQYHFNALTAVTGAEPATTGLANFTAAYNDFNTKYTTWETSAGTQKGSTQTFNDYLKLLKTTWIEDWESKIRAIYHAPTARYIEMFPKGRSPFTKPKVDLRVQAVRDLSTAIGTDAALAAIKTDVDNKLALLVASRTAQQGKITGRKNYSEALVLSHKTACDAMYRNLGFLMSFYYNVPDTVGNYFDLQTLREGEQTAFTGTVKKASVKFIVKRKLDIDAVIRVINTGDVDLVVYIAKEKNDAPLATAKTVTAGNEENFKAAELGDVPTNRYLLIKNSNDIADGKFEMFVDE